MDKRFNVYGPCSGVCGRKETENMSDEVISDEAIAALLRLQ